MYSIQTAVSNGSLTMLPLSIEYDSRDLIHVYFDGVEDARQWAWVGATDKAISFSPAVANGVVVRVQRITPLDTVPNIYGSATPPYVGNAEFDADTIDQNFRQTLQVAQESVDQTDEAKAASQDAIDASILAQSVAAGAVSTANAASSAAAAAQASASTAISTANGAVSTANAAASDAALAVGTANSAASTANTALNTSNTALSTANSASSAASGAVTTANNAASTAAGAVSTANSAASTASSAASTANSALDIATGIDAKATQALDDSADAVDTANNALGVAQGIDAKATQALADSADAVDTANAISGTADAALVAATNALDTANAASITADAAATTANDIADTANTALDTANNAELIASGAADDATLALSTANAIEGAVNDAVDLADAANSAATAAAIAAAASMQKSDNLSGLTNLATARSNLGLGTAAVANLVTDQSDTTSGRALTVGWMGLGASGILKNPRQFSGSSGMYITDGSHTGATPWDTTGYGCYININRYGSTNDVLYFESGRIGVMRISSAGAVSGKAEVWTNANFNPATKANTTATVASFTGNFPWSRVSDKPTTFAPSAHTHTWAQISGAPATATRWPSWGEVTGKPSIPAANQSIGAGAIGQYAFVAGIASSSGSSASWGNTVAGSNIRPASIQGAANNITGTFTTGSSLSGTWRILGAAVSWPHNNNTSTSTISLAVRIS